MRNTCPQYASPAIGKPGIEALNHLAANGLVNMLEPATGLFCHRRRRLPAGPEGPQRMVCEGVSHRYTLMTLLGLHRLEQSGTASPIDLSAVTSRVFADHSWISGAGDLGLVLWFTSVCCPDRLAELCATLPVGSALERFRDAREGRTMELAWFLTGLAHAVLSRSSAGLDLTGLMIKTWDRLGRNQGPQGIFGHRAARGSLRGLLRGRIGSFADQVYPIYALARSAQALDSKLLLDAAGRCADAICRVQGPQGQWWWHYDARGGKVFQRYPVYSVHQEGMGPMSLFALQEASGANYIESAYKGLSWIYGANELARDMRDQSAGVIWRCIYRDGWRKYGREFLDYLRSPADLASRGDLRTLHECRPYELGWLLYAFAGRASNEATPLL